MSARRFYAPRIPDEGNALPLPPDEGRHLARVLRLRAGAAIRVFDGAGREHEATVEHDDPHGVIVRVGARVAVLAEPRVPVTLAVTLLKGRKLDHVVRDATALGVAAIVPLVSRRAGADPREDGGRHLNERWRGIAIASAKQCGRAIVPEIQAPIAYEAYLREIPAVDGLLRIILVEPSAELEPSAEEAMDRPAPPVAALPSIRTDRPPARAVVLVGPEGGWAPDEVSRAAASGFRPLTLGRRILRADLVPTVALSVLRAAWNDL